MVWPACNSKATIRGKIRGSACTFKEVRGFGGASGYCMRAPRSQPRVPVVFCAMLPLCMHVSRPADLWPQGPTFTGCAFKLPQWP
jgi:hypothetical protein